jgi:hypothetical protein
VLAQEATWLGGGLGQLCPLGGGDYQVSIFQFRDPADVILMQMGQDRGVDVGRRVPEHPELGGERVLLANVETGKAIVDEPGEAAGEVRVIGDRRAVLPGVEQDESPGVLDDIGVHRARRGPPA